MPAGPYAIPAISLAASGVILALLWRWRVVSPNAFATAPKQQRDVWQVPAPVWFVCAAMVFLAQHLGMSIGLSLPPDVRGPSESFQERAVLGLCAHVLALLIALLLVWFLKSRISPNTGLRARAKDLPHALVALLCVVPACIFIGWAGQTVQSLVTGRPPEAVNHTVLRMIVDEPRTLWWWFVMISAIIGAPVVEEFLYRAFLQSCLLSLLGRTWPAIIGTSAIFAAAHVTAVPPSALPTLFVLAIGMGVAFERTRSLGVPILMHMLFNIGNITVAILTAGK